MAFDKRSSNARTGTPAIRRWIAVTLVLCLVWVATLAIPRASAELTGEQQQMVSEIASLVRQAATHYKQGEFEQSGEQIEAAMDTIEALLEEGSPEAFDAVSAAVPRIVNAHALLELEGVRLRPFQRPKRPEMADQAEKAADRDSSQARSQRRSPRSRRRGNREEMAQAGPSFSAQIAPLLVQHCGRCHIQDNRGNFNMSNFAMLAKGPPEGTVIFPGDPVGSRLIETIETGDMPRGGGAVPSAHLQLLKDWVAAGAKYDGPSPVVPLAALAAAAPARSAGGDSGPTDPAMDDRPRPTGGEGTVSFAKDVAPILLQNCNGCHIDARRASGGLRLDNFSQLMRGGDSGEIVLPGLAQESLLVRKLKGEEGNRMPAGGRPPLSDEQIELISTWIDEDARFDGSSPDQPLEVMSALAWASSANDEELAERRAELARNNLRLFDGDDEPTEQTTDDFFVIGTAGQQTVEAVSKEAGRAAAKIKSTIDPDGIPGRVTIFVLPKRYDYSEFAKMVEQRSVPNSWQSHWRYDGVDAYIAVLASPSDSDAVIQARLVGPLAALALVTRSAGVPRWFAEGVGRAVTARLAAKELAAVESWNSGLISAVSALKDGKQLVDGGLPPDQLDLLGYAVATAMLKNHKRQYDRLVKNMGQGAQFNDAFADAFGITPAAYIDRIKPALASVAARRR